MSPVRATVGLFTAAALVAAEAPPEDSVAAAKRDLEAIKAGRVTPEAPRVALPSVAAPDFSVGTPALPRVPATKTPGNAAARKKSENWLVEAMQPRNGSAAADSEDRSASAEGKSAETAAGATRNKFEQRPTPRERVEPIVNPLTHYMAGWMTPQDFKLLQPTLTAERDPTRSGREEFAASLPLAGAASTADRLPLGKTTADAASRPPRENPFLAALGPTTPVAASGIANSPTAPRPPVVVAPPAPSPTPAPTSQNVPAFVKPLDDAKYFKPLKKF
jgi:hypothetical protein